MRPTAFASGQEAIRQLKEGESFDLAILDMLMPELDGVMLAEAIRRIPSGRELPLVLVSSLNHRMAECEMAQFHSRLIKPVKKTQLSSVLCGIFRKNISKGEGRRDTSGKSPKAAEAVRLRVLLAEDNPINQKVALRMLDKIGYRADTVANGLEALEALRQVPYDVILMDCQMPEMDGYEATRSLRALEREENRRPVRIIAMTAHAMQGDQEKCLEAGMDDYLGKPVRIQELQDALERCKPLRSDENEPAGPTGSEGACIEPYAST
jgi:CheY-like chemotaxis protein